MARVVLSAIWMNVADDPAVARPFPYVTQFQRNREVRGEVKQLAGGRLRSVRRMGLAGTWSLGLQALTAEDKKWLEQHVGVTLCFRDDRGGRVFGEFYGTPFDEHLYNTEADVSLTVHEVTWDES